MTEPDTTRSIVLGRGTAIGAGVVLLAMAACIALGLWQYGRFEDRREIATVIRSHEEAAPVPLAEAVPDPDAPLPRADEWTRTQMQGRYCTDADCVLYVRNRPLSGDVGFWQLVPFVTDEGPTLLVVRGWVPSLPTESAPMDPPAVPDGEQEILVRLRPAEPVLPQRSDPPGQVQTVTPSAIAPRLPAPAADVVGAAYGDLLAEDPEVPRPRSLPDPETSLGPHLSYAFQWWIFAAFFPAALVYRTRTLVREAREDAEADEDAGDDTGDDADERADHRQKGTTGAVPVGPRRRPTTRRPTGPRRRRGHDEEEEDALIDHRP